MKPCSFLESSPIRYMVRLDHQEILEIEQASFAKPWDLQDLKRESDARNQVSIVSEFDGVVNGYAVFLLQTDQIQLVRMAVRPGRRRKGVGRSLIAKVIGKLNSQRRRLLTVDVPETHLAAQFFLASCGFKGTGVKREHFESGEDAFVMQYRIGSPWDFERGRSVAIRDVV